MSSNARSVVSCRRLARANRVSTAAAVAGPYVWCGIVRSASYRRPGVWPPIYPDTRERGTSVTRRLRCADTRKRDGRGLRLPRGRSRDGVRVVLVASSRPVGVQRSRPGPGHARGGRSSQRAVDLQHLGHQANGGGGRAGRAGLWLWIPIVTFLPLFAFVFIASAAVELAR